MPLKFKVAIGQDEDGWLLASCPELPGCAIQGHTIEEAKANIREAIYANLVTRKSHGLPVKVDLYEVEVEAHAWSCRNSRGTVRGRTPSRRLNVPDHCQSGEVFDILASATRVSEGSEV